MKQLTFMILDIFYIYLMIKFMQTNRLFFLIRYIREINKNLQDERDELEIHVIIFLLLS